MNCVLYARVSTDKQAEKELSIPAQLDAMREYARQHDWRVLEEFVEPGASAKTAARPVLQRLLARIRAEEQIQVVLVHKIDRLARNVYDHAMIKALLKQRGVRLVSVVENVDDSVSGQLVENIMASFAEFYSANLGQEVKKGMRQKVLKGGWPHQPPRGYVSRRTGPGRGQSVIEVHPREGPILKRAFQLYATGAYSLKTLSQRLAKEGLTGSTGRPIAGSYLRQLLENPFYAGMLQWKDLTVPGAHPPLITVALFEQVKAAAKQRYRNPGVKGGVEGFPLRGIAICAECRGRMTAERHERWGYYRCGRNAFKSQACRAKFCNEKRAHADLERICQQVRLTRPMAAAIMDAVKRLLDERTANRSEAQNRLEEEERRLLRTEMGLTAAFSSGDMAPNVYRSRTDELRQKRSSAQQARAMLHADPAETIARVSRTLQVATSLRDLYDGMSDYKRAELIREAFSTIVLSADGIAGFTLKAPFDRFASISGEDDNLTVRESTDLAESMLAA
jgi:site-specific DNA recombinase